MIMNDGVDWGVGLVGWPQGRIKNFITGGHGGRSDRGGGGEGLRRGSLNVWGGGVKDACYIRKV